MNRATHLFIALVIFLSLGAAIGIAHAQPPAPEPPAGPTPTTTQTTDDLQRVGGWPYGPAGAVAIDESRDLLFLSSGGAVLVLDVANPTDPQLVSDAIWTRGLVEDLDYDPVTQRLFIAGGEGGLDIWDVSVPAGPAQLSNTEVLYFDVETPVEDVRVVGDRAYVGVSWGYVHWLDVSDPANPVDLGFNGAGGNPTIDLDVDGNYVYTCGPQFQRYTIEADGSLNSSGFYDIYQLCHAADAQGSVGFMGSGGSLYVLDLDAPGFLAWGVYPYGFSDIEIDGDYAYTVGDDGFRVLDVSVPNNVTELSLIDPPTRANALVVSGDYAYVAAGHAGLRVVDVSDPNTPAVVGQYETLSVTWDTVVRGDYAYTAHSNDGLMILDVSDKAAPDLVGQYLTTDEARDVAVAGDFAYVAAWQDGLRVVDVSDPANPTERGVYDAVNAWRVAVSGDYLYLTDFDSTFRVIDVSDPDNPTEVGALARTGFHWEVQVAGEYAFIANDANGVRVIDVSAPANPQEVGHYPAPDVWDLDVQGDYAYVASTDWDGGFLILDIGDPANPTLVSEYNPSGWFHPYHVAVSGPYAYVSRDQELHLFDVSDPANPVDLGFVTVPGEGFKLHATGSSLYVSDGPAGVQIYENALSPYAATFGPDSTLETLPGGPITHTFTLDNLGLTDAYTLTVDGGAWPATLLTTSPLTVAMGTTATVAVQVDVPHLPPDAVQASDAFTVTATAAAVPTMTLAATGTTNAVVHPAMHMEMASDAAGATPGTTVTYTLSLTNTGDYTDTFTLAPAGDWPATLSAPETGPLAPGVGVTLSLAVAVPDGVADGATDVTTVMATSGRDDTVSHNAHVTTTAHWHTLFLPAILTD